MSSISERAKNEQTRTYDRASSVVFLKTGESFGGLSNMAGGFPLWVNGTHILTSEALYQACRFPHRPEVQALIIEQRSPMTAKMKGKPYRHDSRPDWDRVRVKIMRWCLRVKLAQNWSKFSELLLETGERPIVEESRKDAFWGAKATDDGNLVGMNVLGRLLMELREAVRVQGRESLMSVQPLAIPDFLLGGRPIEVVTSQIPERYSEAGTVAVAPARGESQRPTVKQPSLFDASAVKEASPAADAAIRAKGVHVADLKPYAQYKESRLPWLGQVPAHWSVSRIKTVLRETDRRSEDGAGTLLSLTRVRGLIPHRDMTDKMHSAKTLAGYKRYRAGQLVMNRMQAWSGMFGAGEIDGLVSPDYAVFDVLGGHAIKLVLARLKTPDLVGQFALESKGIGSGFNRLYTDRFGPIPISLPPPDEQAAIVRFLDWATGRLERAIRAKRKVIALLNEQKQAIIHRAVTRGLDPSVPLKPSGVPWLGDIPQHWEVRKMKFLVSTVGGMTPNKSVARFWDGRVPWVSPKDMKRREIADSQDHITEVALRETNISLVPPPAVLIVVRGMILARMFPTAVTTTPVTVNQDMKALTPKRGLSAEFLVSLLTGVQRELLNLVEEAGHGTRCLRTDSWANFAVPLPPLSEQARINAHLKADLATVNTTISRLEREIELLREYRTRLVADVVTGKLDVREAALLLPDEAPLDTIEDAADLADEIESEAEGIEA